MDDNLAEGGQANTLSTSNSITKAQSIKQKIKWALLQTIAVFFWTYAILKLFIFDLDIFLIRWLFPNAIWVIEYRGVIILAIMTTLAVVIWNRKLLGSFLYIAFFPFIVAFFHLPMWLVRRRAWTLTIGMLATTMSLFRSLRSTIILLGFFVVGTTLIVVAENGLLLWFGMGLLGLFIVGVYYRTIREAFRSSYDIFSSQNLDKLWSGISKGFAPNDEVKGIDIQAIPESAKTTWISQLQFVVLYNRLCYFIADKLITLRQGRVSAAIAGGKIAWLFIATLFVFSILNLGLYKLDPTQFLITGTARGFDFLWYTFQASFVNNIPDVVPTGFVARILFMLNGITSGLILFIIVVFFVTGIQTARNADQIDELADRIREQGKEVEFFVVEAFGLTITAAIDELVRVKAVMVNWIVQISPETDPKLAGPRDHHD